LKRLITDNEKMDYVRQ